MAICKLCKKDKKLIDAHIIPKFMFKGMKDENNSFYEVVYNLDENKTATKKTQKEDFDKNILCSDCDNGILGAFYESYAVKSLYGTDLTEDISPKCENYINPDDGAEYSICKNIDYKKMKLFLLSILWRASITNRPLFKEISLGKKHEERIRKIIYEGIDIDELEYPINILSFMRTENDLRNLISQPKRIKTKSGLNGYLFLIDSLQFIFYVNSINHKINHSIEKLNLKKNKMIIIHLPNGSEKEFIINMIKR
ncbi:hypothetical protein B8T70_04905 [Flavobacterium sp. AJR]|nr:hypothetical protein OA93_17865 [Flavobacterium sp. KMS]OUL63444.1 hypothetical protein B8T70_04905 [Flavobacterium sp. AJR]